MKNGRVSRVMNQPASCTLVSGAGKYLHGDGERNDMSTKGFEIRSTVPVCCVCVIVCLRLRLCLCLCLCHVLSFAYVFADHLLVSFTG